MSEIKNGRSGLYGAEHLKCNHMMTLGCKGLSDDRVKLELSLRRSYFSRPRRVVNWFLLFFDLRLCKLLIYFVRYTSSSMGSWYSQNFHKAEADWYWKTSGDTLYWRPVVKYSLVMFVVKYRPSGGSGTFSLGGQWEAMVLGWGIQSEQLQVSYYEPYYASLWFWCLESN